MHISLVITQIILGALLTILVVIQNRGEGLSTTWGGAGMSYHSKRGMEKLLMRLTILIAILFLTTSFTAVLIPA